MPTPTFEKLKEDIKRDPACTSSFWGTKMHPRPDFYKYYWSIFWQGSPCDGEEFLSREYWLSTKKAMDFIEELKLKDEYCWIYNRKLRRLDNNNPFDVNSKWWKDMEWAVSFDDDTDEIYNGHK